MARSDKVSSLSPGLGQGAIGRLISKEHASDYSSDYITFNKSSRTVNRAIGNPIGFSEIFFRGISLRSDAMRMMFGPQVP